MRRILFALALAGCSASSELEPRADDAGWYELETIAGHRPPVGSSLGFYYWGGSLELRPDSTFVDVLILGTAERPTVIDSVLGAYRRDGDSLRMTPKSWAPYAVERRGDEISARWAEGVFVYRRR